MEKLRFRCRVENKVTDHAIFEGEFVMAPDVALCQCLSCGVMGVNALADAK